MARVVCGAASVGIGVDHVGVLVTLPVVVAAVAVLVVNVLVLNEG